MEIWIKVLLPRTYLPHPCPEHETEPNEGRMTVRCAGPLKEGRLKEEEDLLWARTHSQEHTIIIIVKMLVSWLKLSDMFTAGSGVIPHDTPLASRCSCTPRPHINLGYTGHKSSSLRTGLASWIRSLNICHRCQVQTLFTVYKHLHLGSTIIIHGSGLDLDYYATQTGTTLSMPDPLSFFPSSFSAP